MGKALGGGVAIAFYQLFITLLFHLKCIFLQKEHSIRSRQNVILYRVYLCALVFLLSKWHLFKTCCRFYALFQDRKEGKKNWNGINSNSSFPPENIDNRKVDKKLLNGKCILNLFCIIKLYGFHFRDTKLEYLINIWNQKVWKGFFPS